MPRYMLNFNPLGAEVLIDTLRDVLAIDSQVWAQFRQPGRPLANGAVTQVRLVREDKANTSVFRPRDRIGNRYRTTVNETIARQFKLHGKQRYRLRQSGTSEWFWLIPDSRVGSRGRKIDGPGVTVSIYDR